MPGNQYGNYPYGNTPYGPNGPNPRMNMGPNQMNMGPNMSQPMGQGQPGAGPGPIKMPGMYAGRRPTPYPTNANLMKRIPTGQPLRVSLGKEKYTFVSNFPFYIPCCRYK